MKSERGQSLVEFALIIPILLMLLFGIVDFGRIFHAYLTIDHAGREGARAVAIGKGDTIATNIILDATSTISGFDASNIIIGQEEVEEDAGLKARYTVITLNYNVDFITPFLNSLFKPLPISDTTKMRME